MSYEPEILVSTDRDVLDAFRDPQTLTACWDASNDDAFQSVMQDVDRANEMMLSGAKESDPEVQSLLQPSWDFSLGMMPHMKELLGHAGADLSQEKKLKRRFYDAGTRLGDFTVMHVDEGFVSGFISFNRGMDATWCLPSEFAGERSKASGYHFDADVSQAKKLPGMSVYLMNVHFQVHSSPGDFVPENTNRIFDQVIYMTPDHPYYHRSR